MSLFGIDISITKAVIFLFIGTAMTFLIMFVGSRMLSTRPGAYQVIVEELYGFGRNSLGGQMGEEGRKWFPYTLSLFIFLLVLNLIGLVPNSFPVTSSISFTLVLALLTFVITQVVGIRGNGPVEYVAAFVPPEHAGQAHHGALHVLYRVGLGALQAAHARHAALRQHPGGAPL